MWMMMTTRVSVVVIVVVIIITFHGGGGHSRGGGSHDMINETAGACVRELFLGEAAFGCRCCCSRSQCQSRRCLFCSAERINKCERMNERT